MKAAAQRQVEDVHAVLDCRINCVQDIFVARVQDVAGKNVVIPQPRPRRDARHVIDAHTVHHSSFAGYSSCDSSGMCAVVLDRLGIETLLAGFVVEDFRNNNLG